MPIREISNVIDLVEIMAKDIKKLITHGEDQNLEFKTSLKLREEIGETISAFANVDGGIILVGVSDQGKIVGSDIGKKTIEDLANWVKENTDPHIYPDVKVHRLEGKNVVEILIKEGDEKPIFFKDRAFQRVGKTNQKISASKIRELAKQERIKLYWDEKICQEATLDDIDEEKVKWFLKKARYERRLDLKF